MAGYFIRKAVKETLDQIQECVYCGDKATTIDHIYPQNKGGGNEIENLTKACSKCNCYKSDFTMDVFLQRMIDKREAGLNKFYSYSHRFRRYRKMNTQQELQNWLYDKMIDLWFQHKYYCRVIGSIINQKYKIF